jgi:eukaryotic-like serine/threonine-protein kinase
MAQVAQAVSHAHGKGVLHRDLKPANILLDADGRPKVSDFGLAKLLDDALLERADSSVMQADHNLLTEDSTLTLPGRQPGTPAYMAPEQFDARWGAVGLPADVWALGAILYELLAGRRPFPGDTRVELQRRICQEPPAPPILPNTHGDARLNRLARRCLDKDPARRPTAAELADALARYRAPGPVRRLVGAAIGAFRPLSGLFARAPRATGSPPNHG